MKVCVSGVGGDIGLNVGRIFREWNIVHQLYGFDAKHDHPGKLIFDKIDVSPCGDDSNYVNWINKFLLSNDIDLFVPTSEKEIYCLSKNKDRINDFGKILINDQLLINIAIDKHQTLNYLKTRGLHVPDHGLTDGGNIPSKYPVICKPRNGQGSKGVRKVDNYEEFKKCPNEFVWQEYLIPNDQEYTCSVYIAKNLSIRTLSIKRTLVGGYTGSGITVNNPNIDEYLKNICLYFGKPGLFNVQLRLTSKGPILFEINPRVSSTVVFRDKLGFQDLRWWVLEKLNMPLPEYTSIAPNIKIFRGNYEYIVY